MNALIVTIEGGGNVPPVLNLAKQLTAHGHSVRVLSEPCLRELFENVGASFTPFTEYFTKTDRKIDMFEDWKHQNNGFDNVIFGPAKIVVREAIEAIHSSPTDVLIADVVLPSALIAAEYLQVPRVALFHFPEYLPGANRPPGGLGLTPSKTLPGKFFDRFLGVVFHKIFNKYLSKINDIRQSLHLAPQKNVTDLFTHADLRLIQTSKSFDFPLLPAPKNVVYTGPVLDDPDWVGAWESPWDNGDSRPLVVVSFSTTFQNQRKIIDSCIEALGRLEVRGLVTLGPAMEHEIFTTPENIKVVSGAAHSQLFPHAACLITHGGHGSIMRALVNNVPIVCMPMGRDQGDNAAKVAYHGAGINLSVKSSPQKIRAAVAKILGNDRYRHGASAIGQKILTDYRSGDIVAALENLMDSRT